MNKSYRIFVKESSNSKIKSLLIFGLSTIYANGIKIHIPMIEMCLNITNSLLSVGNIMSIFFAMTARNEKHIFEIAAKVAPCKWNDVSLIQDKATPIVIGMRLIYVNQ